MLINDLPDDCLLIIFDCVKIFQDLVSLTKVCKRWNSLINIRCLKIKCLIADAKADNQLNYVHVDEPYVSEDINLNDFCPNLRILEVETLNYIELTETELYKILPDRSLINGFVYPFHEWNISLAKYFPNIEMIVCHNIKSYLNLAPDTINLKQIYLFEDNLPSLQNQNEKLQNLIRLHINGSEYADKYYHGGQLKSIKILELSSESSYHGIDTYPGYLCIDYCPSLQSAYFYTEALEYSFDGSVKNYNLRDLVIQHKHSEYSQSWPSVRRFLTKFPNLEHLAIRNNHDITDENIQQLVIMLPKLKLLDLRKSPYVTRKSFDYVKQFDRSIVIYCGLGIPEPPDWPKLYEETHQFCYGFDFMKNCFYRSFFDLPWLLIPQDN